QLAQQRDDTGLEVPLPQRVLALQRRDRVHGVRAADRLLARLGETEEANLPVVHEAGHGSCYVLDRHRGIHAVLVQQVDVVRLQPAQRALDGFADVCRPAVHAGYRAVRIEGEAEFGGDEDAVACAASGRLQRAGQQLFVRVWPVCLGRVEERHAELDGPVDGGDGLALVTLCGGAVGKGHPHAAEAERGDGEPLAAECAGGQHDPVDLSDVAGPRVLILLVTHFLHPVDSPAAELLLNGDVRHGRGRRRAVPVLFTGHEPDHIAWANHLDRTTFALRKTAARGYKERLSQRVRVPRRAGTRLEGDAGAHGACRIGRLKERVNAYGAGEPVDRSLC